MYVMGTESGASRRAPAAPNCLVISLASSLEFCMRTAQIVPAEVTVQERK